MNHDNLLKPVNLLFSLHEFEYITTRNRSIQRALEGKAYPYSQFLEDYWISWLDEFKFITLSTIKSSEERLGPFISSLHTRDDEEAYQCILALEDYMSKRVYPYIPLHLTEQARHHFHFCYGQSLFYLFLDDLWTN